MIGHGLGEICSLLAAMTWAMALVCFKRSGERVHPLALNLFKNTIGLVLLGLTLLAVGGGFEVPEGVSHRDIWILALSGIIGIALADTAVLYSLNLIGVGMLSIVECLYSPSTLLLSWLLLGEELSPGQYAGAALVVSAVGISTRHQPPSGRTRAQLIGGVLLGALSMGLIALGIVMAKPILDRSPVIWVTTVRMLAGAAVIVAMMMLSAHRRSVFAVFRPAPVWKYSVPASVLGTYISMILWIAGAKYTFASIAAVLNQTSVVCSLILAAVFLKEPLTRRKIAAVALALLGVALVTFKFF